MGGGLFPLPFPASTMPVAHAGHSKVLPVGWEPHGRVGPAGGWRVFLALQDSVAVVVLSSTGGGHRQRCALLLVNLQGFE